MNEDPSVPFDPASSNEPLWRIVREDQPVGGVYTQEHCLELADAESDSAGAQPSWSASVKWDGCVDLRNSNNYWHLCGGVDGINEMIARLQQIKALADQHFTDANMREELGLEMRNAD